MFPFVLELAVKFILFASAILLLLISNYSGRREESPVKKHEWERDEKNAQLNIPVTSLLFGAKFITVYLMICFQLIYLQYFM